MKNEQASYNITSCAALLAQHKKVHTFSLFLTIGSITFMLFYLNSGIFSSLWLWPFLIIILIGFFELIIAMRIGFDQSLLKSLTEDLYKQNNTITEQLNLLDNALSLLKLIPSYKTSRTLNERLLGCVKLLKIQMFLCCCQFLLLIVYIIFHVN